MPLRKHKNGRTQFEFNRIINGQRVRATKLLPRAWTRTQCREYDQKETARLYAVATGQKVEATIEDAVLIYLKEHAPYLKSFKALELEFQLNYEHYQGKKINELQKVMQSINKLDHLSPASKRNYIANIRAACRYAWKFHNFGDRDPGNNVKIPRVKNKREYYSNRKQMLELAKAMPLAYRPYVRIGFYSGMRLGEMRIANVVDNEYILLHDTKNGDSRIVPIHDRVKSTCIKNLPCKYAKTTIDKHWQRAKRKLKMQHLHFHDLRHSAASEMINNGVDLYTVGAVLGHKDTASTKRYAHLLNVKMKAAVSKIGKKIRTA